MRAFKRSLLAASVLILSGPAWAQQPRNWQIGFQKPFSPTQQAVEGLHSLVIWLMALVTIFVAALLGYVMWRYNSKRNPVASRVSHHTALEVAWTVLPVLILVVIAIPSFRLVYFEDRTDKADLTIKVVGKQWQWEYSYPDQGGIDFTSNMLPDDQLNGAPRHLEVDNRLVVPVGKNVRILLTSDDVIHSFFIPSLAVQRYAIHGRTVETWVRVNQAGVFYGECNQICGINHSQMPIAIQAMSDQDFGVWVEQAKKKYAANDAPVTEAAVEPVVEARR